METFVCGRSREVGIEWRRSHSFTLVWSAPMLMPPSFVFFMTMTLGDVLSVPSWPMTKVVPLASGGTETVTRHLPAHAPLGQPSQPSLLRAVRA